MAFSTLSSQHTLFRRGCLQGCRPRDKQSDMPAARCIGCAGELYRGDTAYTWEGGLICAMCAEDKFNALTLREKAALLGAYPCKAGEQV